MQIKQQHRNHSRRGYTSNMKSWSKRKTLHEWMEVAVAALIWQHLTPSGSLFRTFSRTLDHWCCRQQSGLVKCRFTVVLQSNFSEHWAILHGVVYSHDRSKDKSRESKLVLHPHVSVTVGNVHQTQEWTCDWLGRGLRLGVPPVPTPVSLPKSTFCFFYIVSRCGQLADRGEWVLDPTTLQMKWR